MSSENEIPVIDVAKFLSARPADRADTVQKVRQALEEVGFLTIAGHGVPQPLIERVSNASLAFFDRPEEEKARFSIAGHPNRGYGAMRSRTVGLAKDPTLLKSLQEGYGFGRMDVADDPFYRSSAAQGRFVPNVFPDRPAD
ncbi:MAG TPA: 2-oxoglutarate and iron-dependent oxygenase domain-containing protein, partial [Beijerinckiaceae bacterium]|nr:2-oxoglutarate and iron-dependent oxygenase domain-containing protein [Beijerinckiaceae bacterium]